MKKTVLLLTLFIFTIKITAQQTFPNNGPADKRDNWYAFTNATIVKSASEKIENATIIIKVVILSSNHESHVLLGACTSSACWYFILVA